MAKDKSITLGGAGGVTQMRAIPMDEPNFYGVVKQVCDAMLIGGYRVQGTFVNEGENRLVLIFQ